MIKRTAIFLFVFIFCLFLSTSVKAQLTEGGTPYSWTPAFVQSHSQVKLHTKSIPSLDMDKLVKEDLAMIETVRFAAPIVVEIQPEQEGSWTVLANGDRLWQMQINLSNALGLYVVFDDFKLPSGAKLFAYSPDHQQSFGAYTDRNNKSHGDLMIGMITGNALILEYYEPKSARDQQPFIINKLFAAYNTDHIKPSDYEFKTYDGFGDAMACHVNINCSSGDDWQDHKRGIVRMLRVFDEGIGWCTGSLINNTNQDGTPYVLSAFHCIAGFTPQLSLWRFDFNFEFSGCANEVNSPNVTSLSGCTYKSGREASDFLLLELEDVIPQNYNVYFHGWNRDTLHIPSVMTGIHHPRGDVKKISSSTAPIIIFNNSIIWSNSVTTPPNHHYRVFLTQGTIEDGSSGSPLFNEAGLITGQLHGGNAGCGTANTTYYGRFSVSWDTGTTPDTRLSDWLDPAGTGQLTLGSFEYATASLGGRVILPTGTGIGGVTVKITGPSVLDSVLTDNLGNYQFPALRQNEMVTLDLSKEGLGDNGITIGDVIAVQSEILSITELTPYETLAADVNDNNSITIGDLINIRKILLQVDDDFALGNWKFAENAIGLTLTGNTVRDIIGVKRGDVNFNADPNQ